MAFVSLVKSLSRVHMNKTNKINENHPVSLSTSGGKKFVQKNYLSKVCQNGYFSAKVARYVHSHDDSNYMLLLWLITAIIDNNE